MPMQRTTQQDPILAEYERAGLPPVYADQDHTMLVSISMLLHNGWRIERVDNRAVLMRGDEVR